MPFNEKVVVVTGESGAIGRAICFKFASKGGKVYVSGRTEASVKNVVSEIRNAGLAAEPLTSKIFNPHSVEDSK